MCGRYKIELTPKDLDGFYILINELLNRKVKDGFFNPFMGRELTPGSVIPCLTEDEDEEMKWGFTMDKKLIFNGRSESVTEKTMFRNLIGSRRCIVPSTQYYEWGGKNKYEIRTEKPYFFMAGLYRPEENEDGKIVNRALILTTDPNDDIRKIHDRMPVILSEDDAGKYLDKNTDISEITRLLKPWDGKLDMNIKGNEQLSFF